MHPIDPLRGFVTHLLPARLFRRFRISAPTMPDPAVLTPSTGVERPLALLVRPGMTALHVGGNVPNDLAEAIPMMSRLRAVPIELPLDLVINSVGSHVDLINCSDPTRILRTLRGAGSILSRERPAWRLSIDGNPDDLASSTHAVFHLLARRGYTAFVWDGESLRPRPRSESGFSGLIWYYFLTNRHLQSLPGELFRRPRDSQTCQAA